MIVVTTPTGRIGRQLVRELVSRGRAVRVISRDPERLDADLREAVEVVTGSHDAPDVLDQALPGADALFVLVPPNPAAPSAREHYLSFATAIAQAARRHRVGHLVGVTSAGHGWTEPAGVLSAAFAMDAVLADSGAAYRALSLPFYMENLIGQLETIRTRGAFALTCDGDQPLATVATRDVAEAAADLLTDLSWTDQENVPLFGPDRLSPHAMAAIIGEELGRPVAYHRLAEEEFAGMLRARGASEQAVTDMVEMFAAQDGGIYDADWAAARTAVTDFRTWCREVLRPAAGSDVS